MRPIAHFRSRARKDRPKNPVRVAARVVNFPEPAWPTPSSWLGGKIDIGIENERRLAAIDGNKHADFYLEGLGAVLW